MIVVVLQIVADVCVLTICVNDVRQVQVCACMCVGMKIQLIQ